MSAQRFALSMAYRRSRCLFAVEPAVYRTGALPQSRRNKRRGEPIVVDVGDGIIIVKLNGVESNKGEALNLLHELHGSSDLRAKWIGSISRVACFLSSRTMRQAATQNPINREAQPKDYMPRAVRTPAA